MDILLSAPRTLAFDVNLADGGLTFGSMPQKLSRSVPYGSTWVLQAKDRFGKTTSPAFVSGMRPPTISAWTTADLHARTAFKPFDGGLLQGTTYLDDGADIFGLYERGLAAGAVSDLPMIESSLNSYITACNSGNEMLFWAAHGCSSAEFTITNFDCEVSVEAGTWDLVDSAIAEASNARYLRVRSHLQDWLGVSIDELASLLDLSPTTVINLTKPGRVVRPKTVRKMMIVYGLLSEFQRTIGQQTALTWARTVGYRLLSDGDMYSFEQYISTHIFPTVERKPRGAAVFGTDDAELSMKPSAAVGRPSRI